MQIELATFIKQPEYKKSSFYKKYYPEPNCWQNKQTWFEFLTVTFRTYYKSTLKFKNKKL